MSKADVKEKTMVDDVQQLREILFGDQVEQLVTRMEALEKALKGVRKENRALRQALEIEASASQKALQAEASARKDLGIRHKKLVASLGKTLSSLK